jgi:hypothetical protein
LEPPVNRQNCKARLGGICVFARDFFCKYVHVNDPFTNSSHCVFWFTIDERLLLQKTLFGVVYSKVTYHHLVDREHQEYYYQ